MSANWNVEILVSLMRVFLGEGAMKQKTDDIFNYVAC